MSPVYRLTLMLIFKDISANWLNGMDDGWQAVVSGEEMEKLFF